MEIVTPSVKLDVEGCLETWIFKREDSDQYILLIGEDHSFPGNSIQLLRDLVDEFDCPIDVLIEKAYQSFWDLPLNTSSRSNVSKFFNPPFDICLDMKTIPKEEEVGKAENFEFYRYCVAPFKGRIKFWGIDLRRTSLFQLLLTLGSELWLGFENKYKNKTRTEFRKKITAKNATGRGLLKIFKNMIAAQKTFYDFQLYALSPDLYHKKIVDSLKNLYSQLNSTNINEFSSHINFPFTITDDLIRSITKSSDKSHMDFARQITTLFPFHVYKQWQEYIYQKLEQTDNFCYVFLNNSFLDLAAIVRLRKLIRKQKQGIMVLFAGNSHCREIANLLTIQDETFSKSKRFKVVEILSNPCDPMRHETSLTIPKFECKEKTKRTIAYQKIKTKSKKV